MNRPPRPNPAAVTRRPPEPDRPEEASFPAVSLRAARAARRRHRGRRPAA